MKWLVDIHAGKFQLVLFYHLKCCSAIDVEIDGSVLGEKLSFKLELFLSF